MTFDQTGKTSITNGLTIEKKGEVKITNGEVTLLGESKNEGKLTMTGGKLIVKGAFNNVKGADFNKTTAGGALTIDENGSFVNNSEVKVTDLVISGSYTSAHKDTTYTNLSLKKGGKFVDSTITEDGGITIAQTVNFEGGNFYTADTTPFAGKLTVSGTANFDGADYTFTKVDAGASGNISVDNGTLTVTELKSTGTGAAQVTTETKGAISIGAEKAGFSTSTDGKKTVTVAAAAPFKPILNKGKILVTGLDGNIDLTNLGKVNTALVTAASTGLVDLGDVTVSGITITDNKTAYNAAYAGLSLNQLKNVTVTGANAAGMTGSYGAVQYATGTPSAAISSTGGTLELNGSGLIVSEASGKAVTLNLVDGDVLRTTGEGAKIGEITSTGSLGTLDVASGSLESVIKTAATATTKAVYSGIDVDTLRVAEGAKLTSLGDVTVKTGTVDGSVNIGTLTAATALEVNGVADIEKLTGTLSSGPAKVKGAANIQTVDANVDVVGSANVGTLNASKTINVGDNDHTGKAVINTVEGKVFADPAWENSTEHSSVAVNKVAAGGWVEAGRNSLAVVGSTDIAEAEKALGKTGFVLAEKGEDAVQAAVLVRGQKSEAGVAESIEGHVYASGAATSALKARESAGTSLINGTANDGLMIIDVASLGTGDSAVFEDSFVNNGTLYLANVKAGDTVKITEGTFNSNNGEFESDAGRLLSVEQVEEGSSTLTVVVDEDKVDNFAGLSTIDTIVGMYKAGAYDSKSGKFNNWLMSNDNDMTNKQIIALANDAAMIGATSAVASGTMDAVSAFNDSVAARTNVLAPRAEGVTVWADVMGGHYEAKELMDGKGYKSDVYGGVLGVDSVVNGYTLGAAFTVATADTDSTNTLVASSTDSDFVGFSVYGAKAFGQFNVAADLGYMKGSNDVSVKAFNLGDFSADTSAFTAGVRGEVLVDAGSFKVVPHAGLRFTHLTTDDFESAYTTEIDSMNVFQMPVGVTVTGNVEAAGWNVAPMFDLSVVPAFGDTDADMTLGINGVATTTALSTQVIDSNLFQMKLGVAAQKDAFTFGINYKLGAGSDRRVNNTFNATVSYAF